jgi:hypothetical protein
VIYVFPDIDKPIRQGDIFSNIPRVSVSLTNLPVVTEGETHVISWASVASEGKKIKAVLPVMPVYAIVATQDCDTITSPEITLCEIREFKQVEGKAKDTTAPKAWQSIITQHARINEKWFYLPPDPKVGFSNKMAVDFRLTIRIPREDLKGFLIWRKGSLNALAKQHFRERIGQFFRRYPYNEWYPLNPEELNAYERERGSVEPKYPWHQSPPPK